MDILSLFAHYRLIALFCGVLIEQIGVPIPAMPLLIVAGVAAADDPPFAVEALGATVLASMLADLVWFFAGRRYGRRVLGLLCRISISPDTCVRNSEISFARRGNLTLVFGKFIPGISILTSPMAGAIGMRFETFVIYNLAGTALWACSGIFLGMVFNNQARQLLSYLAELGNDALPFVMACVALYVAYRIWRRWRVLIELAGVQRMAAHELYELITRGDEVVVVDVRPKLNLKTVDGHVPGATRIELSEIESVDISGWAVDAKIVVYCACPNDASALRAAHHLIKRGRHSSVLKGGLDAWTAAGFAMEMTSIESL